MENTPEQMERFTETLTKLLFSMERVENILTNNALNNGKGLVAQVQDQDKRLRDVETFIEVYDSHKAMQEKETNKAIAKMGVWAAIAGIIISAGLSILFFILTKK